MVVNKRLFWDQLFTPNCNNFLVVEGVCDSFTTYIGVENALFSCYNSTKLSHLKSSTFAPCLLSANILINLIKT